MKARKLCMLFMALLTAGAIASAQVKQSGPESCDDSRIVDAVSMIQEGKIPAAVDVLRKITSSDAANDAAWYYLGTCYLQMQRMKEAQDALKKAVELDKGNYWYRERLGEAYSMAGEDELTLATYEQMLKDFPKKDEIWYTLVNLYLRQGQFTKALESMDNIEQVFGKNENITAMRYEILLRQDKPEEAFKAINDFNAEYSSPRILSLIGDHEMAEYKDSAALAHYKEAQEIQGSYYPALLGEAEVYRTRRNYDDYFATVNRFIDDGEVMPAVKVQYMDMLMSHSEPFFLRSHLASIDSIYSKMVAMAPEDSTTLASCAMFSYSAGDIDKAKALARKNIECNPESARARISYLQMLGSLKDWDGIISESSRAIKDFPGETAFYELDSYARFNKEDYRGVITDSENIIRLAMGDTSKILPALSTMGDMYHQLGENKKAYSIYEKVLKIDPKHTGTLNNYAWYLAISGKKLKKALAMSKISIEKEPDNPTFLDTYGWILHLLGKDADAKAYFKHAMLYGGKESSNIMEHYSVVLEALGETDLSKVYKAQAESKKAQGL